MDPVIQEWGDNIIEIEWTEISGHGTEGTGAISVFVKHPTEKTVISGAVALILCELSGDSLVSVHVCSWSMYKNMIWADVFSAIERHRLHFNREKRYRLKVSCSKRKLYKKVQIV